MVFCILDDIRLRPAPIGTKAVLARDQARVQKILFRQLGKPSAADASRNSGRATDPGIILLAFATLGDPPTSYALLVDGEYDNIWIDGSKGYIPSSSSGTKQNTVVNRFTSSSSPVFLMNDQKINYGSAEFTGAEYTEQLTFGNYTFKDASIIVASDVHGFDAADGVLGVDRHDIVSKTSDNSTAFETVLSLDGLMTFTYFPTSDPRNIAQLELNFGEVDPTRLIGNINYTPFVKPVDAQYSNTDQMCIPQNLKYGSITILESGIGVLDFMNTLVVLATEYFEVYQAATRASLDDKTGLLTVTEEQFNDMKNLVFKIGSETYELTPDAQVWPRALNESLGGEADRIYLVIADSGTKSGSGFDIICGYSFMRHFYTVYDAKNHQMGLATTQFTNAATLLTLD